MHLDVHREIYIIMVLSLPAGEFHAYLFDCDGTIVDSMPLHFRAWQKALAPWGCEFSEDLFYAWGGRSIPDIISTLNARDSLRMPVQRIAEQRENYYYDLLTELRPIPEVLEHILDQHGHVEFAVVSGSIRESVVNSLKAVKLVDKFPLIVSAEDYQHSKPAPDAHLAAAERLGMAPAQCLVFEDTDFGIQSATAAGMKSVRVPSPLERRKAIARQAVHDRLQLIDA